MASDTIVLDDVDSINNKKDIETTINYSSIDSIFYDLKTQTIKLYGKSKIDYGDINLEAHEILVDWNEQIIDANYMTDSTG